MKPGSLFVISVAFVVVLGCGKENGTPPVAPTVGSQSATSNSGQTSRQEFEGFSFEIPKQWKQVAPDRDKTKAVILLDGTSWQDCKAMIKVDVGTAAVPTAAAMASSFAKSAGGQVVPEAIDFDGESAAKATTLSTTIDTPREMMIIIRKDKAYLVMAAAVQGVDMAEALEQIRSSWKWSE